MKNETLFAFYFIILLIYFSILYFYFKESIKCIILTGEIEIELGGGREGAAADYRQQGKVNR